MARTREEILERRKQLRQEYGQLFDAVSAAFYRHDPIGINFDDNADEYDLEAETVLPKLRACKSEADVLQVVHSEFVRWFDADTAGPLSAYVAIAGDVWRLWQAHLEQTDATDCLQ